MPIPSLSEGLMVRKRVIEKVVAAVAATLVLEASGELLDRVGLSEEEHRVARVFVQNMVSAVTGVILGTFMIDDLHKADNESGNVSVTYFSEQESLQ
jgi:hypothetical protein